MISSWLPESAHHLDVRGLVIPPANPRRKHPDIKSCTTSCSEIHIPPSGVHQDIIRRAVSPVDHR
jgi:hypothetical protein